MRKLRESAISSVKISGVVFLLCVLASVQGGCVHRAGSLISGLAGRQPRIRLSCYASSTVGTTYVDPENLGRHGYRNGGGEKNGIVYTCRGGHIDIAHLRKAADWTAFLAEKTFEQLRRNRSEFSFKFYEPSKYIVHVSYPSTWATMTESEKEVLAREISIGLGQYFAFIGCTWHEILTWFGYRPLPFYPEFPSAFSWEDTYSNLLGTHIAGVALRQSRLEYDEAMTVGIRLALEKLGVQPRAVAVRAAEQVRGKWFSGEFLFFVTVRGRNFDIGLDDGFVTPWVVPSIKECPGAEPLPYPVPSLDFLSEYGFSVKLEIEPKEAVRKKILRIVYPDWKKRGKRIEPSVHFGAIMEYIRQDARKRYGEKGDSGQKAGKVESDASKSGQRRRSFWFRPIGLP